MRATWLMALVLLIGSIPVSAETQVEDFVYDSNTDTYIFTFWGREGWELGSGNWGRESIQSSDNEMNKRSTYES